MKKDGAVVVNLSMYNNATGWDIHDIRPQATPFALLGLYPAYELDMVLLEQHYLILQRTLHPDRFVNKPIEGHTAEMMSAWVNRAYTTLKDPVLRAQALLKIKGCAIPEDQTSADPVVLAEALEWRQKVEEVEDHNQKETFLLNLQEAIKNCEHDFNTAWQDQNEQNLKINYLRLSYLMKTKQQAKEISFLQRAQA
jgi:molecular chaperone HscB